MLSDRIREARTAAGLSQVELAAQIGATERSVSLWENTTREPSFRFLVAIAVACSVGLDFFRSDTAA